MNKRLALLSIGSAVSISMMIVAAACSSDNQSEFPPGTTESDATFDQGGFNTDGNTTGQDVIGNVNCTPSLPVTFAPNWKPPTQANVCSDDDINGYYDNCLGNVAVADAGATCAGWRAAHDQCAKCIETEPDNNGAIQWHRNRLYFTLNVAGCLSILRNETATGTCAAAYDDSFQCQRESCRDCLLNTGANFKNFQDCQTAAEKSACATYESKRLQLCANADAGAECFRGSGETQKPHFTRVQKIFCGTP
jgi:hypothetical protein